jgi:hypothetical protein
MVLLSCFGHRDAQNGRVEGPESLRCLNACFRKVLTKGTNDNRISIAFSVERKSGMDSGDLGDPTASLVLKIRPSDLKTASSHCN